MANVFDSTTLAGATSYSGTVKLSAGSGLRFEPAETALNHVESLLNAIEAGAPCRCAPTEVCPDCHTLRTAAQAARDFLSRERPLTQKTDLSGPAVTVTTTGTLHVGTLHVGPQLTYTDGT